MDIKVVNKYGVELIFKAENVKVSEDVEGLFYEKKEDGSINYTKPERDIKTEVLEQFSRVLDDLICCRKADFDSNNLIMSLFEKLPQIVAEKALIDLNNKFGPEKYV